MPIQLEEEDGTVLAIRVSGKLHQADYEEIVPALERFFQQHGKLCVRFDRSDFHGWDAGAAWEGTQFGPRHFADIECLALAGETR